MNYLTLLSQAYDQALYLAARTPDAWGRNGIASKLRTDWLCTQMNVEPRVICTLALCHRAKKVDVILRYGLGLDSPQAQVGWLQSRYHAQRWTCKEIAEWLSIHYIPVSMNAVHRGLLQRGIQPRPRGRR